MTLSGPPESFPDLRNPAKRQMLVSAVHASLDLPSSYPLGNIQLWIQTETSVAAAPTRHLLSTSKVFVLGYTLIQTTELPSTPELQATLASPAAVEAIAQSLEQDGLIAPEYAGSVFVGLSTAGPDEIVNQIVATSPSTATHSTNLGQSAVTQFVPIGESCKDPLKLALKCRHPDRALRMQAEACRQAAWQLIVQVYLHEKLRSFKWQCGLTCMLVTQLIVMCCPG